MIHGGPGAAGEMAPVAQILAKDWGVLEPWQTARSLTGQVEELKSTLEENGKLPVTLVGYSWGAWLSFIMAAHYPALVKKLILVSSGPFAETYARQVHNTRLARLNEQEREEIKLLSGKLADPTAPDKDAALARFGELFSKADAFDYLSDLSFEMSINSDIFNKVWPEALDLRKSGKLLALAQQVKCPVVALHGDHDPHPADGVQKPLSAALKDFRFHVLERCGHKPWQEKQARDNFFAILQEELNKG